MIDPLGLNQVSSPLRDTTMPSRWTLAFVTCQDRPRDLSPLVANRLVFQLILEDMNRYSRHRSWTMNSHLRFVACPWRMNMATAVIKVHSSMCPTAASILNPASQPWCNSLGHPTTSIPQRILRLTIPIVHLVSLTSTASTLTIVLQSLHCIPLRVPLAVLCRQICMRACLHTFCIRVLSTFTAPESSTITEQPHGRRNSITQITKP